MEAKEEIYQYIRKHIKEDGVTAQSIAEIFGIKKCCITLSKPAGKRRKIAKRN